MIVGTNHRVGAITPTSVEEDKILAVSRERQRDIGNASPNVVGVVHPSKPTVRPFVLEQVGRPIRLVGHAVGQDRIVHETTRSRINSETDKIIAFGNNTFLPISRSREFAAITFLSRSKMIEAYASRIWLRSRFSLTSANVTVTGKFPVGVMMCGLFCARMAAKGSHATNLPLGTSNEPQGTTQVKISPRSVTVTRSFPAAQVGCSATT